MVLPCAEFINAEDEISNLRTRLESRGRVCERSRLNSTISYRAATPLTHITTASGSISV